MSMLDFMITAPKNPTNKDIDKNPKISLRCIVIFFPIWPRPHRLHKMVNITLTPVTTKGCKPLAITITRQTAEYEARHQILQAA